MTVKVAAAAFALESVAEQATFVLPIGKRVPELGLHVTGREPSRSSWADTRKATRADFTPFLAFTVLLAAPVSVGCVTSNAMPGTSSVPVQVSRPCRPVLVVPPSRRSSVPLPVAPAYIPVPPVTVNVWVWL